MDHLPPSNQTRWRGVCGPDAFFTHLEDGRRVCIRRIEDADEQLMREGIARLSPHSRYLRFFSGAESPPDQVIADLLDVDGHDHLAWGAIDTDAAGQPAIGAVHAIRMAPDAAIAEFSIAILDEYHGLGLGRLLTATLLLDAADEAMGTFRVHTLAENTRAIDFVRSLGARHSSFDGSTVEYALDVKGAIGKLKSATEPAGLADVFHAFDAVTPTSETSPAS